MNRTIRVSAFALAVTFGSVMAQAGGPAGGGGTAICKNEDDEVVDCPSSGTSGPGTPSVPSTPPTPAPPAVGSSATINFNNVPNAFTTYSEGDYQITLLSGSVVGGSYGAGNTRSISVLGPGAQAYVPPLPGVTNTVGVTRIDGGLFSLDSFFSVLAGSAGVNTTTADGYLLGTLVSSSTTTSSVGGFAFAQSSGLSGYYDQVRLTFSTTSSSSAFDNLTVTALGAVPEPATWAMMVGGFGLIGGALRRRRTRGAFA